MTWAALLLLLARVSPASAADYWVATEGHDVPAGGARSRPWATLQYAARRARPGDTVHVAPGRHAGFVLGWDREPGGTEGHPITFRGEPGAVIDRRNGKTPDGINLEGASYIHIEGFQIHGMGRAGIRSVQNRGVVIRRNVSYENRDWGVYTSHSEGVVIEGNVAARSRKQHGIYVSNSADRPVIRANRVYENANCGIHMNGDAHQGGDGIISGALVERNMIHDNGTTGGAAINCDGIQDSRIVNNLIYSTHSHGIALFRIDGGGGATGNTVVQNTIILASDARWALNIRNGSTGNVAHNNIFFNSNPRRGAILVAPDSREGFVSDYNVLCPRLTADDSATIINLERWQALGYDRHSRSSSPEAVFRDPARFDFRLRPGSPAIDFGLSNAATSEDLELHSRPVGAGPDAGAFESKGEPETPPSRGTTSPTGGD